MVFFFQKQVCLCKNFTKLYLTFLCLCVSLNYRDSVYSIRDTIYSIEHTIKKKEGKKFLIKKGRSVEEVLKKYEKGWTNFVDRLCEKLG